MSFAAFPYLLLLLLFCAYLTTGEDTKDTPDLSISDELFVSQLDKAATFVDRSTYSVCSNGKWTDSNDQDDNFIHVSCHSVYEVCGTTLMYMSSALNLSLSLRISGDSNGTNNSHSNPAKAYGYGFIMVSVISMLSLLGLVLVPCLNEENPLGQLISRYLLTMLTAMGVSALLCDVLFELLPTIFHISHDHPHDNDHVQGEITHNEAIWKATGIAAGVFAFYLLELILHSLINTAAKKNKTEAIVRSAIVGDRRPLISTCNGETNMETRRVNNNTKTFCQKVCSFRQVRPLAWIILIGDLMHNAADGIALGVAVSQSLALGLSTAFAIGLHEIPHEMADFGILVKSGLHWVTALMFNFLSSLTAIVGFFIGVAISTNSATSKEWLLAIAAGSFLYIALADLLPELRLDSSHNHDSSSPEHESHLNHYTCCQKTAHCSVILIGFSLAFAVLLAVSLNEERLNKIFA
ncbi:PREDICTED: zinc transporter ZIP6-like isoform X1 [Amphimedon queenslandica]|uniref:Zinc transporter ZIP4 N-terminal domain-containing protein n=1 Tax=Amphimedon queenslandica TaxID=400682 RepID=A0AAN0IY08_AMPQE|nr:PREDICTED: zinc transporter ZIP6-like isoform X1 [Amphimedon queenslandica]|eukprot:XP_019849664.1 PREDICTED: zinc transporter ZIP6-like isoform X1 [Amphimedon queenslandica]